MKNLIKKFEKGLKNYKRIFFSALTFFSLFHGTVAHAYQYQSNNFNQNKNFEIIQKNSTYTNANIEYYYYLEKAKLETKELLEIVKMLCNNSKFKNITELLEQGKVKVNTANLLEQLKYYLEGWPKYTDTRFNNNGNDAGIIKILEDYITDSGIDVNIPSSVKTQIENSLKQLKIFQFENEIKNDLNKLNKNKNESHEILYDIMYKLNILIQQDINDLSKLNIPKLDIYNKDLKEELIEEYRIYAKTTLLKSLKIFAYYIGKNYEMIYSHMEHCYGKECPIYYSN